MKVVSITNIEHLYIIKGNVYEVYDETNDLYLLKNEKGFTEWVNNDNFKDISKVREEKLKELGI